MRDQNEQLKINMKNLILMYLSKVYLLKGKKTPQNLLGLFKLILQTKLDKSLESLDGVLYVARKRSSTANRLVCLFALRNVNKHI